MRANHRLIVAAAAAVPVLTTVFSPTRGADLDWDIDPITAGIQGGAGTWTTTASVGPLNTWFDGLANVVWDNALNNVAVFSTGSGTITLDGAVTVGGMTFNSGTNYTFNGGTLGLALPQTTFTNTGSATVNSQIVGSGGLRKLGGGTLALSAANTYTGGTLIEAGSTSSTGTGALQLTNPNALGTGAVTIKRTSDYTPFRFDFGVGTVPNAIALPTGAEATGRLNFVTTGSTFTGGVLTTKQEATLSGVITGGGPDLVLFLNLSSSQADGGIVLTNPANSFTVNRIQLNRGKIGVGATGALGNPNNVIYLDVTRNGIGNAGTGLHFTSPNVTIPNPISLNDQTVINVNGHNGSVISGDISTNNDTSAPYSVLGGVTTAGTSSGSLELSGNNTYAHAFEVLADTKLIVGSGTALGSSFRGTTIASGATLAIKNGINYANDDFGNGGEQVILNGSGVLSAGTPVGALQGMGTSSFTGRVRLATSSAIGVDAGGTLALAGELSETGGTDRALTKIGTGTLVIDTNATYTGNTIVSAGVLRLGSSGDLPATNVQVQTGATLDVTPKGTYSAPTGMLISGTGTVTGTLSLPANTAVAPGTQGTAGTLNTAGLVLDGGRLRFDLDAPGVGGTNDLLEVNGNISANSLSNVAITPLAGILAPGSYRLVNYTGSLSNPGNLQIEGASAGTTRQTFSLDTATPGQIDLDVAGTAASLVWAGGNNGNAWDVVATQNWLNGVNPDKFYNLDSVLFDNGGSDSPAVNITSDVGPIGLVVDSSSKNYTFSGSGRIVGSTGLTKSGSSTLSIETANTYTGATTLNAGVLQINSIADAGLPSAIGSAPAAAGNLVLNGGTLRYVGGDASTNRAATINGAVAIDVPTSNLTIGGALVAGANPGSLTKLGNGTLILQGNATYTGTTTISAGTLQLGNNGDAGSVAGNIVNNGELVFSRSDVYTYGGSISGTGLVRKTGDGDVILTGNNAYQGGTTVISGALWLGSGSAAGTGPIVIADGAQLNFRVADGSSTVIPNDITIPAAAGQQFIINNGGPLSQFTRVELSGKISGGGAGIFRMTDTGFGGNHFNELKLSNVNNDFTATIELWRGRLVISDDAQLGNPDNDLRHYVENGNGGLLFDGPNVVLNPQRDILLLGSPPAVFITPGSNVGTVQGVISSSGSSANLVKTGTGTLVLTNANTYTSNTEVQAGTLLVNNTSGSGTGTGNVTVSAGATLGGTGSIAGAVTVNGTVAPGNSVGTLTAGGNATFVGGSNLNIEIASASSYDQLVVTGAGTFNGNVNVSLLGSFVPASGDVFTIISGTNVTGAVGNLNGQGKLDVPGGTFEVEFSAAGLLLKNFALAFLKGDMNADNAVNNQDIAPFVLALTNYPQYQVEYPGLDGIARGDINLDSVLNNQDIAPFVALLTGPRPLGELAGDPDFAPLLSLVPEPASLSLLALGGLALRRRRA